MFDFRVEQRGAFRFMYLLPISEYESLVEYTLFSPTLLPVREYEGEIERYLRETLGLTDWEIVEREDGIIPMTEQPFPRRGGNRIMYTGTKGGRVKASTGFAFHRTQKDSRRIVDSLLASGQPFHGVEPPKRYRTFDSMLLAVLDSLGGEGYRIFIDLFEKNPIERVFRFLDEEGSLPENIALMNSVPWWPFIAAWFRVKGKALGAMVGRREAL